MFANNDKISARQCARLLFFDFLGIGTLVLPGYLAELTGEDGIFAIAVGVVSSLLYLKLLQKFVLSREDVFLSGQGGRGAKISDSVLLLFYACYYLILGGFALYLFGTVILKTLLTQESFWLITLLCLVLAAYGMARGMESRARVYEVLFWLLVVPFVLMLILGAFDVSLQQLLPMVVASPKGLAGGSYLVFLVFSLCQMLLFAGNYIEPERAGKAAVSAVLFAGILFAVLYEILLGVFGRVTVTELDFPAVSLMSMVTLPGGFLHRQDALMVGVWFFTLFALICSCMYYSSQCVERIAAVWGKDVSSESRYQKMQKRGIVLVCGILVYGISYRCFLQPGDFYVMLERFFWFLTPLFLAVPFLRRLLSGEKKIRRGVSMLLCAAVFLSALSFSGCSVIELEDRSFPLLIAVGEDGGNCRLIYKFQDLGEVSSQEKSSKKGGNEQEVTAGSFYEAMEVYQEENGKYLDLNHVKAVVLEQDFVENESLYEDFLTTLQDSPEISKNILIYVTEDVSRLTELSEDMDENMGTFLEDMLLSNPAYDSRHQVTLGTVLNDRQDERRNLLLPFLTPQEKLPAVTQYYLLSAGQPAGIIDKNTGDLAGVFQKKTKILEEHISDRCHMKGEELKVKYEFSRRQSEGEQQIICTLYLTGKVSLEGEEEVSEEQLEQCIAQRLEQTVGEYQRENRIDLTDSYDQLSLYSRELAREFAGDIAGYEDRLVLEFKTDFDLIDQ